MLQTILHNVVLTIGVVMMTAQPEAAPAAPVQVAEERMYTVAEGESLSQIAETNYKNKDAWVTLLKDNPQITDPNVLEEGTVLKIRIKAPTAQEIASSTPVVNEPMHDSVIIEAVPTAKPTVKPVTTTAPTVAPVSQTQTAYAGGPLNEAQITYLGNCEAGMDPAKNTGNGYYGAFQFSYGTWKSMGTAYERADMAPLDVQKDAVQRLLSRSSIFTQFPGCAKKMRALGMI